jgi:hypothetical protein
MDAAEPDEPRRPIPPSPVAAAAGATDTIGRLTKLERQLADGELTPAEFEARRAEILRAP